MLLVADNASSAAQVEPLLPGTPVHRVLVTSRHTLASLPARLLDLETLDPADAVELITRSLTDAWPDDDRPDEEPEALARLAERCGLLPLALRVAAALLKADPYRSIDDLADELADARSRLTALRYEDGGTNALGVRAAFDLSYARLSPEQARLFRFLPLNPGPSMSTEAAAALAGEAERPARALLSALAQAHLVERVDRGRWRMHDLVRVYADELGAKSAKADDREGALDRLFEHYVLWTADAHSLTRPVPKPTPSGRFKEHSQALAWLERERPTLVAATQLAAESGRGRQAERLARLLHPFLHRHHYMADLVTTARASLKAAHLIGSRALVISALHALGTALREAERGDEALTFLKGALSLTREAGDPRMECDILTSIGMSLSRAGRHDGATRHYEQALAIARACRDLESEAASVMCLGVVRYDMGRYHEAILLFEEALALMREAGIHDHGTTLGNLCRALFEAGRVDEAVIRFREVIGRLRAEGDRLGEIRHLMELGSRLRYAGRPGQAITCLREAVALCEENGYGGFQGASLANLGETLWHSGDKNEGRACLKRAVELLLKYGAEADAEAIRAYLQQLPPPPAMA
ncbi:tetratricopeptide repeat protein [Streptomyces sp. NPDC026206]|uniref:tetratricopeptide repeat protein n=1 Tax=Streptomyces sp. NPDC026206 TaxID=3157089 RepID=UPI00340A8B0E